MFPDKSYDKKYLNPAFLSVAISMLLIVTYGAGQFTALPAVLDSVLHACYIGATVQLIGVNYGIFNDMLACRTCIEYFTDGHTAMHRKLVPTNDPNINAFAWGVHATWGLSTLAGVLFGVATLVCNLKGLPTIPSLPLLLAVPAMATVFIADKIAHKSIDSLSQQEKQSKIEWFDNHYLKALPGCDNVYLSNVPKEKRLDWLVNGQRNAIGYIALPATSLIALIASCVLRTKGISLAALSFSPSVGFALATLPCLPILVGGLHFYQTIAAQNSASSEQPSNNTLLGKMMDYCKQTSEPKATLTESLTKPVTFQQDENQGSSASVNDSPISSPRMRRKKRT